MYLFRVGVQMLDNFNMYMTTKIHLMIHYMQNHIVHVGYIREGSSS